MLVVFKKEYINNLWVLLPFVLVYTGSVFSNMNASISSALKISAFAYMLLFVVVKKKVNRNLFIATLLFLPILIYGIYHSFYWKAGLSDGIRFLFPIVTLFYGYSIRDKMPLLVKFIAVFVVINFMVQIVNYINWLRGVDQWFYYTTYTGYRYYNMTAGVLRATGIVVFFGFYGFLNLIAYFILRRYYFGKYRKLILGMALFSFVASISYKTFMAFALILIFYFYKQILKIFTALLLVLIGTYLYAPQIIHKLTNDIIGRIQMYIIGGHTVRTQSYKVMFQNIIQGNWFGEGVGSFGGPASTTYHSPYYEQIGFDFNDFQSAWLRLPTTDTYLPHAVVELGIIGSVLYFIVLIMPLLRKKIPAIVLIIYATLFFDMLFSFSLNNLEYLLFSFVFIYPIYWHENVLKKQHET